MTDVAAPVFKKRANKAVNIRKRPATPPPAAESDSEYSSTDDDEGRRIKRRRKEGIDLTNTSTQAQTTDLSKSTSYAADRSKSIAITEDATKASNWYTDAALAAKDAPPPSHLKSSLPSDADDAPDGTYRGTAKYSNFIEKNPNAAERHVGPVKAPTNIRTITVTDFAPDVCKDYKQTGFCGFGDSCKFLHAREDYKQGWQLDKEWEKVGKQKKNGGGSQPKADEDDLDPEEKILAQIPFKCIICKSDYKNPVTTKCGHYFCQKCAMARFQKEKKRGCAACGKDTGGSFAVAKKLKDLLERKRVRVEEKKEKRKAAGESLSSDDDDDDDEDNDD